ncbi:hypothetical protein AB1Y20_018311 [Prymnesium parvum]|uniref:Uncharacterized protein n=1 Tax=Prymnesium parvum TaxID=97485 RepID=A0AB34JRH2_PRYPA
MALPFPLLLLLSAVPAASAVPRARLTMALTPGSVLPTECLTHLHLSASRALVLFLRRSDDLSALTSALAPLTAASPPYPDPPRLLVILPPPLDDAPPPAAIRLAADAPFALRGRPTTPRRVFEVGRVMTAAGEQPRRASFVLDAAGVVRAAREDEGTPREHAEFAAAAVRELQAAGETEAEAEFRALAVPTADGKGMAVRRKSAVGRMREKMERERAAREEGRRGEPGWWPW